MKEIDKGLLIMNANYIVSSLEALQTLMDYRLGTDITVEDLDQVNSIVVAIKSLAQQHADDMEQFELEM